MAGAFGLTVVLSYCWVLALLWCMDVVAGYYFLVKGRGEGRRSLSVGGSG